MLDLRTRDWDARALELAGVGAERLSRPALPSTALRRFRPAIARELGLTGLTAVVLASADGPLANVGVGGVHGDVALTLGTSGAVRVLADDADPRCASAHVLLLRGRHALRRRRADERGRRVARLDLRIAAVRVSEGRALRARGGARRGDRARRARPRRAAVLCRRARAVLEQRAARRVRRARSRARPAHDPARRVRKRGLRRVRGLRRDARARRPGEPLAAQRRAHEGAAGATGARRRVRRARRCSRTSKKPRRSAPRCSRRRPSVWSTTRAPRRAP